MIFFLCSLEKIIFNWNKDEEFQRGYGSWSFKDFERFVIERGLINKSIVHYNFDLITNMQVILQKIKESK